MFASALETPTMSLPPVSKTATRVPGAGVKLSRCRVDPASDASTKAAPRPPLDPVAAAICVWLTLGVAVAVKTAVSPDAHTVFPKLAARALDWWAGRPMYVAHEGLGRFPYSPTFAIALTPFAVLGHTAGGILWTWVNMGAYVWGLRRSVRDVLPGRWTPPREAALLLLAMIGAVRGIWNAQSNALIIGLLMLGASAIARRRWWPAAALLAAPCFIKVWPLAISLLFVAQWPRKLAGRVAVAIIVGAALPFAAQRSAAVVEQYRGWHAFLVAMSDDLVGSYRDVWTLLRLFEVPVDSGTYRLVQALAAAAALGWCLRQRQRASGVRWPLTAALGTGAAWSMLFGPAVEYNTFVVLAPTATWALLAAVETARGKVSACTAFVMTMLLGAGTVERSLAAVTAAAPVILPVGTAVFLMWLVRYGPAADAPETNAV